MSRILVLYGTTHGQTRKVALVLGEALEDLGCTVEIVDAALAPRTVRPEHYDAVIVAASVHMGGYQRAVKRWVRAHEPQLARRPTAFVSVCLAMLEQRQEARAELDRIVQRFLGDQGWRPDAVKLVAGAVRYTRYNGLVKWIMKRIVAKAGGATDTTRDWEYTDWADVRAFARDFALRYALAESGKPRGAPGPSGYCANPAKSRRYGDRPRATATLP